MLYAVPPDASRIWNGCEPPELLMKRYFFPLIKYKSGLSAVLTTPLPAKRYAEDPFAVTVYTTCISELVGSDAGKLVRFAPLIAGRVPVKLAAGKFVSEAPEPLNVPAVNTFEDGT